MAVALTINEEKKYILKADSNLDKTKQTVFTLKALNNNEWIVVNNCVTTGDKVNAVLVCGLVGWENFRDKFGNLIEFTKIDGAINPDLLAHLSNEYRYELSAEIVRMNKITEEEVKNSDSPD